MLHNTWSGAFGFDLSRVAEPHGAVRLGVSQESLAKAVNPLVQLIWNVGCLEFHIQITIKKTLNIIQIQGNTKRRSAGNRLRYLFAC